MRHGVAELSGHILKHLSVVKLKMCAARHPMSVLEWQPEPSLRLPWEERENKTHGCMIVFPLRYSYFRVFKLSYATDPVSIA